MDLGICPRCGAPWSGGDRCNQCLFVAIGAGLDKQIALSLLLVSDQKDNGFYPIAFADGHAKSFSAKEIADGVTKVVWRFR